VELLELLVELELELARASVREEREFTEEVDMDGAP
jgi:hypothetical protein